MSFSFFIKLNPPDAEYIMGEPGFGISDWVASLFGYTSVQDRVSRLNRESRMTEVFLDFNSHKFESIDDPAYKELEGRCIRSAKYNPDIKVYVINPCTIDAQYELEPALHILRVVGFIRDVLHEQPNGNITEISAYHINLYKGAKEFAEKVMNQQYITEQSYNYYRRAVNLYRVAN